MGSTAAPLIGVALSALTFHRLRKSSGDSRRASSSGLRSAWAPVAAIAALVGIGWGAVALDYYDRHFGEWDLGQDFVQEMGLQPPRTYFVTINTAKLRPYSSDYKLMLIVRAAFIDVDKMSDPRLEKSSAFTITGASVAMAVVAAGNMRLAASQPNTVEWNIVLIPSKVSAEHFPASTT